MLVSMTVMITLSYTPAIDSISVKAFSSVEAVNCTGEKDFSIMIDNPAKIINKGLIA